MLLIIGKVLIVFVYIGIGFAANKLRALTEESVDHLVNLIMEITMPCLVISSIAGQELDEEIFRNTIHAMLLAVLSYAVVAVVSVLLADRIFPDRKQAECNVFAVAMTSCNSGFMGYPITRSVFGPTIFYYVVIENIANNIYLFCMAIAQLHHREQRDRRTFSLREALRPFANMTMYATAISLILLFGEIRLPASVMEILTTVGDVTIPVSMILVGVQLGGSDLGKIFRSRDMLVVSFIKLIAAPALNVLLMLPLPVDPAVKLTTVICMCFPSAVIGVALAVKEHRDPRLMSEAVAATTMLSMFTLPVWIVIVSHLYL